MFKLNIFVTVCVAIIITGLLYEQINFWALVKFWYNKLEIWVIIYKVIWKYWKTSQTKTLNCFIEINIYTFPCPFSLKHLIPLKTIKMQNTIKMFSTMAGVCKECSPVFLCSSCFWSISFSNCSTEFPDWERHNHSLFWCNALWRITRLTHQGEVCLHCICVCVWTYEEKETECQLCTCWLACLSQQGGATAN